MASSLGNLQSEPSMTDQIITEFYSKSQRIILESRSPNASSRRNYSGERTFSSPSSTSSSSSARNKDKWFNLALGECPASLENLDSQRHSYHEPLVIDVILVQSLGNPDAVRPSPVSKGSPRRNPSLRDQFLGGWNAGREQFISDTKCEKIIERWTIQYESGKSSGILRDLSSGSKKRGSSTSFNSSESPTPFDKKTYKRSIILLRSLYVTVRLLPAYKIFRDLNSSGKIYPFSLAYKVSSFVETFTRREEAKMKHFSFVPVDTTCGRLSLSVVYYPKLLDVNSEPLMPISTQFIPDYVGSPTTDPLRRFPSLPLSQSPTSPSPVRIVRWNSWSNDLHRATAPSFSASPSPTYSDSRNLALNPSFHHLPPRGRMNIGYSPPVSSTHHGLHDAPCLSSESLVHKENLSFDEYWPSPPFSPSRSPSPPTHVFGSHSSKALLRTESAPVSIPSARLGCGLPNTLPPPSPSPKGTGPGCSSPSECLRDQSSLMSASHSCPTDCRFQPRQDPRGPMECQASSSARKMLYFAKDNGGNLFGTNLPISRSYSKRSFQDEFHDCGNCGPFTVDDITDPFNRSESFTRRGHTSGSLGSQGLQEVVRSHDAAIGFLIDMLQNAAPLQQDLLVPQADSWRENIQPNQNLMSARAALQTSELNTGTGASRFLMSNTTANALEGLKSFIEIKELLLQQRSHQPLDAVQTAITIAKGTSEL